MESGQKRTETRQAASATIDMDQMFRSDTQSRFPPRGDTTVRASGEADVRAQRLVPALSALGWLGWQVVRIPLSVVLAALEPFVSLILSLLVIGSFFAAVLFRFIAHAPHFPFWAMVVFCLACAGLLALYRGLLSLVAR
jgi:hypothetical protein